MARRKRGIDVHGWLLIDKPSGVTSSYVVNKIRHRYNASKAGHGGTLDPDATGLLPIAFGEATKLIPFLEHSLKTYEFTVNWGASTTTDDAAGEVVDVSDNRPTRADILAALTGFIGQIEQIPPAVSAVKIDGERAYKRTRDGEQVDIKSRPLWVEELTLLDESPDQAEFRFKCGKGGYVRSIARDLGADLGCFGHVAYLRRTATLGFDIADAISLDEALENAPDPIAITDTPEIARVHVNQGHAERLGNGNPVLDRFAGIGLAIAPNGRPIAVVKGDGTEIKIRRGLVIKGGNNGS